MSTQHNENISKKWVPLFQLFKAGTLPQPKVLELWQSEDVEFCTILLEYLEDLLVFGIGANTIIRAFKEKARELNIGKIIFNDKKLWEFKLWLEIKSAKNSPRRFPAKDLSYKRRAQEDKCSGELCFTLYKVILAMHDDFLTPIFKKDKRVHKERPYVGSINAKFSDLVLSKKRKKSNKNSLYDEFALFLKHTSIETEWINIFLSNFLKICYSQLNTISKLKLNKLINIDFNEHLPIYLILLNESTINVLYKFIDLIQNSNLTTNEFSNELTQKLEGKLENLNIKNELEVLREKWLNMIKQNSYSK